MNIFRTILAILLLVCNSYLYAQDSAAKTSDLPPGYIKDTSTYSFRFNQKTNSWDININSDVNDNGDRYALKKHFTKAVDFSSQNYIMPMYYNFFKFDSAVAFGVTHFGSLVDFFCADFYSMVDFYQASFDSSVSFWNVHFKSMANFSDVSFIGNVSFVSSHFHSKVLFMNTRFSSYVNFNLAHFKHTVDFTGSYFGNGSNFKEVILPDTLIFKDVKAKEIIDLTFAKLDTARRVKDGNCKCKILLEGADIDKIKINYDLFTLYFTKDGNYEQQLSIYEKLLKKFKDEGFLESYKALDIEYRDFKFRHEGDNFLNWFQKHWWNYGYEKELVLWRSLLIFGIFTFLNLFFFGPLQRSVYKMNFPFYTTEDFEKQRIFVHWTNEFFRKKSRIIYFVAWAIAMIARYIINPLIYTAILFFGIKLTLENFKKFSIGTIWVFTIYTFGIFCLAYIINIIIVK